MQHTYYIINVKSDEHKMLLYRIKISAKQYSFVFIDVKTNNSSNVHY